MKTTLNVIITFLCISCIQLNAQVMWQLSDNSARKWYLQFNDEFEDTTLNAKKWMSGLPWGNAKLRDHKYFIKENIEINNHTLKLKSKKEKYIGYLNPWEIDSAYIRSIGREPSSQFEFDFTGAQISTYKRFKNGYFELRFKTQGAYGMWPSFWLFGGDPNEEIDFFELKGDRDNQIHVDMHCPDGCANYRSGFMNLRRGWGGWITVQDNLAEDWNIVSGEWQKDYVKIFLNGTPIAYFKHEFKTSQFLILGNAPAKPGKDGAFRPGPDERTPWPNHMEVDYVRVWSEADTILELKNQFKPFEFTPTTVDNGNLYHTDLKKKLPQAYNKKELETEKGTITLLPVSYNQYSISLVGKQLGSVAVTVTDKAGKKVADYNLTGKEYFLMDLSRLDLGDYQVSIAVLNQVLTHTVPVLNLKK